MSRLDDLLVRLQTEDATEANFGEYAMVCRASGVAIPDDLPLENPAIRKLAGYSFEYNNECAGAEREDIAYAHALLADGDLPPLDATGATGYDLTHRIFYASDFGRVQLTDAQTLAQVTSEIQAAPPTDLLGELLCCDVILQGASTSTITVDDANDDVHTVIVDLFLGALRAKWQP